MFVYLFAGTPVNKIQNELHSVQSELEAILSVPHFASNVAFSRRVSALRDMEKKYISQLRGLGAIPPNPINFAAPPLQVGSTSSMVLGTPAVAKRFRTTPPPTTGTPTLQVFGLPTANAGSSSNPINIDGSPRFAYRDYCRNLEPTSEVWCLFSAAARSRQAVKVSISSQSNRSARR